jgi:sugar-phosphatase
VVTSASVPLAKARLEAAGVEPPRTLITAEDVERGKPDPAGYLKAAEALGFAVADCLVFEDAEAGIQAGEAAGADVVVVTAARTHPLETTHPTLKDYGEARLEVAADGRLLLTL